MTNLKNRNLLFYLLLSGVILLGGCATLDVSPDKILAPATAKQPVVLGIQASGERLQAVLKDADGALATMATGTLFDKVLLLPVESKHQQPAEIATVHGVDYILYVGISDISVSGDLNPIWFFSMPLLVFKPFTPIVTFQPTIVIEASLKDARSGAVIMNKELMESATDHFSPMNPGEKVRGLISRTLRNSLVTAMRDAQSSIAAIRSGQKPPQ
jgi:hypothetical protein